MNKTLKFILSASLIVVTGKGSSVLANPINSTQADLMNLPQTSELLVKDLRDLRDETIPETPSAETTVKTNDAEKSLCEQLASSQQKNLETPEIEILVISTQSLLKCTESKPEQPLELAQDVPAATEFEQTAPEGVEPANPPINEQPSQTKSDLAAQSQNPLADLISLPFQHNLNFGTGPRERLQYVLIAIFN
jgi:hypothetical protein